ncbi:amidohydrolase [Halobellus sp. Atlit-38R]|uniref:amidohydrolase family protein n=2 Tax=Haloferacaceae TaxID=1644056 RepID=UPI000EF19223|nr:amidohydrolase family protein [Halobellus sp. Atlit-38R]RLM83897.1 amidohydrolase [Halobellus sp. Atlit-38R]
MLESALHVPEEEQIGNVDELDRVVDADMQVQETPAALVEHMDDSTGAHRVVSLTDLQHDMIYAGPSSYPLYEYKRTNGSGDPVAESSVDEVIGADDVAGRAATADIDAGVINPTLNLGLSEVNNDRFAVALASAYNDWLLSQLDEHSNLVGNAVVAPQHPTRAAEEIDRLADEDDIVGVQLPASGLLPPPGHRQYEPLYDAAEAHDLPIAMKSTVGNKSFGQQYWWAQSFPEDFVYQYGFVQMRNLTSLLFEGVPERYDIDFVIQGAGVGFVPFITYRLDDHYLELGYEIPALSKLPSAYLSESFYWTTQPMNQPAHGQPQFAAMVNMVGPENVLFASDLPQGVSDLPEDVLDRLSETLTAGELQKVMSENTERIYGL